MVHCTNSIFSTLCLKLLFNCLWMFVVAVSAGSCVLLPSSARAAPQVQISEYGESGEHCVMLLHGLARTSASMRPMAEHLADAGFAVVNIDYPSRHFTIRNLSEMAVPRGLANCRERGASQIYAVAHSLGGILMRDYLSRQSIPDIVRIVMLAPPNQGSEVVDKLRDLPGFQWLNGPAGGQLGTDESSIPRSLGPIEKDTAVIAGTTTINLFLSTLLEDPDDGKVSLKSTRLNGMCAFLSVPAAHPFIMKDETVMIEVHNYLSTGRFENEQAEYPECRYR